MTREEARTALGDRNNLLWGMSKEEQKYYSEALDMAITALEKNESAEEWYKLLCEKWDSAENKGEWIKDIYGRTICSYCGEPRRDNRIGHINFCNCCGADMRGKADENIN